MGYKSLTGNKSLMGYKSLIGNKSLMDYKSLTGNKSLMGYKCLMGNKCLMGYKTTQDEIELDSKSWLEREKGGRTSLQHPWPDGPTG